MFNFEKAGSLCCLLYAVDENQACINKSLMVSLLFSNEPLAFAVGHMQLQVKTRSNESVIPAI